MKPSPPICTWPACVCRSTGVYCSLRKGPKKPKRINPISKKGKVRKGLKMALLQTDAAFYWSIWEERTRQCESCSAPLGPKLLNYYFDHLLEKQTYPELRHEKDNIMLVCGDCHTLKTDGHATAVHKQRVLEARKRFNK